MNKDQVKGKLEQVQGQIKQTWGRLTSDDVALYEGKRKEFLGKLREKYGYMESEAESKLRHLEQEFDRNSDINHAA